MMSHFHVDGTIPKDSGWIFVFGSNVAGRHGAGAALVAKQKFGAIYGEGFGLHGNSFAIPTKDHRLKTIDLKTVSDFIEKFNQFASDNPEMRFWVTAVGCGLAGYKKEQIAPLFKNNSNCSFPIEWKELINVK